MKEKAKAHQGL